MRSEISHVHPEIRTQIPDEIIDCNLVSFSAPFADNHSKKGGHHPVTSEPLTFTSEQFRY